MLSLPLGFLKQPVPVLNRPNAHVTLNFHTTLSEIPPDVDVSAPVSISSTLLNQQGEDYADMSGMFVASSEHGCMVSRLMAEADGTHKEIPWKSVLPLGNVSLGFDKKPPRIPESTAKSRRKEKRRTKRQRHRPKRTPGMMYLEEEAS